MFGTTMNQLQASKMDNVLFWGRFQTLQQCNLPQSGRDVLKKYARSQSGNYMQMMMAAESRSKTNGTSPLWEIFKLFVYTGGAGTAMNFAHKKYPEFFNKYAEGLDKMEEADKNSEIAQWRGLPAKLIEDWCTLHAGQPFVDHLTETSKKPNVTFKEIVNINQYVVQSANDLIEGHNQYRQKLINTLKTISTDKTLADADMHKQTTDQITDWIISNLMVKQIAPDDIQPYILGWIEIITKYKFSEYAAPTDLRSLLQTSTEIAKQFGNAYDSMVARIREECQHQMQQQNKELERLTQNVAQITQSNQGKLAQFHGHNIPQEAINYISQIMLDSTQKDHQIMQLTQEKKVYRENLDSFMFGLRTLMNKLRRRPRVDKWMNDNPTVMQLKHTDQEVFDAANVIISAALEVQPWELN